MEATDARLDDDNLDATRPAANHRRRRRVRFVVHLYSDLYI
jgi:hypothetical protein